MNEYLLSPPAVCVIIFLAVALASTLFSRLAFHGKEQCDDAHKQYSCGEELPPPMVQPDYSQFFHFAYYFTILHVAALLVATIYIKSPVTIAIAVVYIIGASMGMFILMEK